MSDVSRSSRQETHSLEQFSLVMVKIFKTAYVVADSSSASMTSLRGVDGLKAESLDDSDLL
jgi:hypothetical protein